MKSKTLLEQFERLERLIERLPEGLQKPILHEIVPLKELFLRQRAPRLVLAGDPAVDATALFAALFNAPLDSDAAAPRGWHEISRAGRGSVRVLDARPPGQEPGLGDDAQVALSAEAPDVIIFLQGAATASAAEIDAVGVIAQCIEDRHGKRPTLVGLVVSGTAENPAPVELDAARRGLELRLAGRPDVGGHLAPTLAIATAVRFRPDGTIDEGTDRRVGVNELADLLVTELPNEAKLDMARSTGAKHGQGEIARILVKSVTAASGAIGAQPIPLADLPFLLALQVMMVSGILYISGRETSMKLGAEFLGSLGLSFGAGFALRELARSLVKVFPGWGNAISGVVAAGGTYALGRTAIAYFVEGVSLAEAKKLFRRQRKEGSRALLRSNEAVRGATRAK